MTKRINLVIVILFITLLITLAWGYQNMFHKKIHKVKQPFRIAALTGNHYYLFPPPEAMLYFDKTLPDGTDRYYAYIDIKGLPDDFQELHGTLDVKSLTAYPIANTDISKMHDGYPVNEEELLKILNTKRLTKAEAQEVIDYLQQYLKTIK